MWVGFLIILRQKTTFSKPKHWSWNDRKPGSGNIAIDIEIVDRGLDAAPFKSRQKKQNKSRAREAAAIEEKLGQIIAKLEAINSDVQMLMDGQASMRDDIQTVRDEVQAKMAEQDSFGEDFGRLHAKVMDVITAMQTQIECSVFP
ncbi:Uncharacterized protein Adt_14589 [Abeliophyllum distichum]|uniref:Uncharacterized protein n=1 Tax=Abeliophyllum distichum TaxID=126358 RepID=A0ABD1U023_9LAMI